MSIRVRPLEANDKRAWLRLFHAYIAFYEADVADAVVEATWQRLLDEHERDLIGLIAVDLDAAPIGLAHVVFHRSTWSQTWYCYLEDLFVDPQARGHGIGRALIEAVYAAADARGATRTYWATQESNTRARALYDRVATRSPFIQYRR